MVQSDAGRVHALGSDGLSGPRAQALCDHADSGAVHDGRLLDLYLYRRRGTGSVPESHGIVGGRHHGHGVLRRVFQPAAA